MAIKLTDFPATVSPSDVAAAILEYDSEVADGPTKEILVRAAALGLFAGADHASTLIRAHPLIETAIADAQGTSVTNAVVKQFVKMKALGRRKGESKSDAAIALASAVSDVLNSKRLTVTALPAAPPPPMFSAKAIYAETVEALIADDISGLDLLSEQFEPLRVVLTRTLAGVCPGIYAEYRRVKDSGTATARQDAYAFAFDVLAHLIAQTKGQKAG